jgi:hypothetical protein
VSCEEFVEALSLSNRPTAALFAHARSCKACGWLWQADRQVMSAAPSEDEGPALSPELQRALHAHSGATRAFNPWRSAVAAFTVAAAAVLLGLLYAPRTDLRQLSNAPQFWLPFAASMLMMAAGLHLYVYRDRSGLGAPAPWRWAFVLTALVMLELLSLWQVAHTSLANAHDRGPRDCLAFGLLVALCVGGVLLAARRRTALVAPGASGALAGCIGGLAAVVFLHVHCGATYVPHLQLTHVLPLLVAMAIGAFAGRRLLAV